MRFISIGFFMVLFLLSCNQKQSQPYSFFAAGHAYGNPQKGDNNEGIYQPFKNKFNYINNDENIELGFFLGDVVWKPNKWDTALKDIAQLKPEIYYARGNHDGKLKPFEERFGKSYKSFLKNGDLFIILDANIDNWNIDNEQLTFFRNEIRNKGLNARNIFVFTHQVIWWTNNKFSKPFPNSIKNKDKDLNYWSVIEPLLRGLNKPVFLFAGDVGAFSKEKRGKDHIIEYAYFEHNNIKYISTGMGGGVRDNFVITDIDADGNVDFRLIHLNGDDINSLGNLKDYKN